MSPESMNQIKGFFGCSWKQTILDQSTMSSISTLCLVRVHWRLASNAQSTGFVLLTTVLAVISQFTYNVRLLAKYQVCVAVRINYYHASQIFHTLSNVVGGGGPSVEPQLLVGGHFERPVVCSLSRYRTADGWWARGKGLLKEVWPATKQIRA
jgi:hypothetical protein